MSEEDQNKNEAPQESGGKMPFSLPNLEELSENLSPFSLVKMLFATPSMGLLFSVMGRHWVLPFLLTCVIFGVGSCAKSISEYRHYTPIVEGITTAVAEDLAPLAVSDEKIAWSENVDDKYSKVVDGWRISARRVASGDYDVNENAEHNDSVIHGLTLLENGIVLWFSNGVDFQKYDVIKPSQLPKFRKALSHGDAADDEPATLSAENTVEIMSLMCVAFVPFLAAGYFGLFLGASLFCSLIFGVSSFIFRRGFMRHFWDGFIVGFNACLPAALISIVWYMASPFDWDFHSIFYVAFILYLLFVFLDSRNSKIVVSTSTKEDK